MAATGMDNFGADGGGAGGGAADGIGPAAAVGAAGGGAAAGAGLEAAAAAVAVAAAATAAAAGASAAGAASFLAPAAPASILQMAVPGLTVDPSSTMISLITPAQGEFTGIEVWKRKNVPINMKLNIKILPMASDNYHYSVD